MARRQIIIGKARRGEHRPAIEMRIIGAFRLDSRPKLGRRARRVGQPGIIAFLIGKRMGEGEIDADKKRRVIGRAGKFEKPVQHRHPPPVTVPLGVQCYRRAASRRCHRQLDPGLARPARA